MEKNLSEIESKLKFKCDNCPAIDLRTNLQVERIAKWYELRLKQLAIIEVPRIILLCESFPNDRYIYDLSTSYITMDYVTI